MTNDRWPLVIGLGGLALNLAGLVYLSLESANTLARITAMIARTYAM
jgi:hypothetical protein